VQERAEDDIHWELVDGANFTDLLINRLDNFVTTFDDRITTANVFFRNFVDVILNPVQDDDETGTSSNPPTLDDVIEEMVFAGDELDNGIGSGSGSDSSSAAERLYASATAPLGDLQCTTRSIQHGLCESSRSSISISTCGGDDDQSATELDAVTSPTEEMNNATGETLGGSVEIGETGQGQGQTRQFDGSAVRSLYNLLTDSVQLARIVRPTLNRPIVATHSQCLFV